MFAKHPLQAQASFAIVSCPVALHAVKPMAYRPQIGCPSLDQAQGKCQYDDSQCQMNSLDSDSHCKTCDSVVRPAIQRYIPTSE